MGIEFFTKGGRGYAPKASIRKPGQIGLNQGAILRFGIKNNQLALLGYDREKHMVAIKLVETEEDGAKRIIVQGNSGSISAKSFFDFFGISCEKTIAYDLKKEESTGLIVFYLASESKKPEEKSASQ